MNASTKNVFRNVFPSLVVMAVGLLGAFMVLENSGIDGNSGSVQTASVANQLGAISPAAGGMELDFSNFESTTGPFPPQPEAYQTKTLEEFGEEMSIAAPTAE